jgi:hypothetical protein
MWLYGMRERTRKKNWRQNQLPVRCESNLGSATIKIFMGVVIAKRKKNDNKGDI